MNSVSCDGRAQTLGAAKGETSDLPRFVYSNVYFPKLAWTQAAALLPRLVVHRKHKHGLNLHGGHRRMGSHGWHCIQHPFKRVSKYL